MASTNTKGAPLTDAIIIAVAQLVDDSQVERRDPAHSDLESLIKRCGLAGCDPKTQGLTVGKAKRIRATLSWALEHASLQGGNLVYALVGQIRGYGGFRSESSNFVGTEAVQNCAAAFGSEGYVLSQNGELQPKVLDALSGTELTEALEAYVRRAKKGVEDAALVTGTGKDLLEAIAAHIIQSRYGSYPTQSNFPTLLGQAYAALCLATPQDPVQPGEGPEKRIERAMFDLACAVNGLRNKQGTGHGRPWLATVSESQALMAIESMGVIGERLLAVAGGNP